MNTNQQSISHTPLSIKPRRMSFPFSELTSSYFFDNNMLKSAYIAALSATFPAGEAEFIASVRLFRDQVTDSELKEQIKGFIGQEAHHSQQHIEFNRSLKDLGFDVPRLEKVFEKDLAWSLKHRTPEQRLAFTACFEHHTAILAHEFLSNPKVLEGMEPQIANLMRWHAVEEIEHKGVAFDLYMQCVGDRKLLRKAQRVATTIFSYRTTKYMLKLLWWAGKMPSFADIRGYYRFMFGKEGLITHLKAPYREFFRDDFHPWDHDNRYLIEEWQTTDYTPQFDRSKKSA